MTVTAGDLVEATLHSRAALTPLQDSERWTENATDLDWSCRDTLDHVINALVYYAGNLARRTPTRPAFLRTGAPDLSPPELLDVLESAGAVLAGVVRGSPPDARAYHRAGMADPSGFAAMGCAEILVHTEDIATALGGSYRGPDGVTDRVIRRLFPWAPEHADTWERFRWCVGRGALPSHERQGPDWWWWCAPLAEWTGGMTIRTMPEA
jgi:hypothetical protein